MWLDLYEGRKFWLLSKSINIELWEVWFQFSVIFYAFRFLSNHKPPPRDPVRGTINIELLVVWFLFSIIFYAFRFQSWVITSLPQQPCTGNHKHRIISSQVPVFNNFLCFQIPKLSNHKPPPETLYREPSEFQKMDEIRQVNRRKAEVSNNYRKIPKYSDTPKTAVIILQFEQCGSV